MPLTPQEAIDQIQGMGDKPMPLETLTPRTQAALDAVDLGPAVIQKEPGFGVGPEQVKEQFIQKYQQPGVPLDIESGGSAWEQFMVEARRNKENAVKYIESKYGPGTARLTDDGQVIARVPDPDNKGKSKDLLIQPYGALTLEDIGNLSTAMPEIGGWVIGERLAKTIPMLGKVKGLIGAGRDIVSGATGAAAGGGLKDIGFNVYDRGVVDLPEVATERGKIGLGDIGIGMGSKALLGFFKWIRNPANPTRPELNFDALGAQKYFADKYGKQAYVPLSIGESTGIPIFQRSEAFVEKEPGGSGPLRKLKAKQEDAFRRLQSILVGTSPPLDEEVGTEAIEKLRTVAKQAGDVVDVSKEALQQRAQGAIMSDVASTTWPTEELRKTVLGKDVRAAVVGARDSAKAEADRLYDIVRQIPGSQDRIFDGTDLQKAFAKIKDRVSSAQEVVSVPTGLVNQLGQPIKTTVTQVKPLRQFVPTGIMGKLDEILSLKNPSFSLQDLKNIRSDIMDSIGNGEGVPGLGVHYLDQMSDAVTDAIKTGINKLPSGNLKTALQNADTWYRTKVIPFNRVGLTEMFRQVDEPGGMSDSEIVSRLLGGEKATRNWQLMKETIGNQSIFDRMRRTVADNIIQASKFPGEDLIDAKSFIQNLSNFIRKYPEISDEVFRGAPKNLFTQAKYLAYAQEGKISSDGLRQLLQNPNATAQDLRRLIDAERAKDALYKNQIVKAVGDGVLDPQTVNPSEFVNRLLDNGQVSAKSVQDAMGLLSGSPDVVEDIQRKTFEKIFREASRTATAEDVNRVMSGNATHILSGTAIVNALKDRTYLAKIKAVLSPEQFMDLEQYVKLQGAVEAKEKAYSLAGGLAGGARVAQLERVLERRGLFAYTSNVMRSFVFSWMLTNPAMRSWLGHIPRDPHEVTEFMALVLSSPPFLKAVAKEFPDSAGAHMVSSLKHAISDSLSAKPPDEGPVVPPSKIAPAGSLWADVLNKVAPSTNAPAKPTNAIQR